jgi:hypothetical protein
MGTYDSQTGFFENRSKLEDLPVQSPTPLGKSFRYFMVTQQEVSPIDGKGASVGLATCSVSIDSIMFNIERDKKIPFLAIETNTNMFIDERLLHLVC